MPKSIKEERLSWVRPIANKEIKLIDAVKVCPHSTRPKTTPKETPIHIKKKIIQTRKKY